MSGIAASSSSATTTGSAGPTAGASWPSSALLPRTGGSRNGIEELDGPLNLGADEEEQVWTGESVGLGFGLLTKGKAGLDAINWDCRICGNTASDPCVTRCGHLFCWNHLQEYLTRTTYQSSTCPTCKAPTRMDRDVVQVFGRPKALPEGAPWTSVVDTPASDCSFGPPADEDDSQTTSDPSLATDHTQYSKNLIYPASHNSISSDRLNSGIQRETVDHDPTQVEEPMEAIEGVVSPSTSGDYPQPPPPSSPVHDRRGSVSRHSSITDVSGSVHYSGLGIETQSGDATRRPSTAATNSWTSRPASSAISWSGSSAWDNESNVGLGGSKTNYVDLSDEPLTASTSNEAPWLQNQQQPQHRTAPLLTGRPMKGFWSSKQPVNWRAPPPRLSVPVESVLEEQPEPPISPQARRGSLSTQEVPPTSPTSPTSPTQSGLRTRGLRPGQTLRYAFDRSSSESDDISPVFRPSKPFGYDTNTFAFDGGERPTRTPLRKTFRNMDTDYNYPHQENDLDKVNSWRQRLPLSRQGSRVDLKYEMEEDDSGNPLSRALSLAALAIFLMVLLK